MAKPRSTAIDSLRGIAILAVIASHAVILLIPRAAFQRCDLLGPGWLDCDLAALTGHAVLNVQAVLVFAVLSGMVVKPSPGPDLWRRGLRLWVAAALAAGLTALFYAAGLIDGPALAGLFTEVPSSHPMETSLTADPGAADAFRLAIGLDYVAWVTGERATWASPWPAFWCVPWLLLGWLVLAVLRRVPPRARDLALTLATIAAIAAAAPLGDPGVVPAMLAGFALRHWLIRLGRAPALLALLLGLAIAVPPDVRQVVSPWVGSPFPDAVTPLAAVVSALLIVAGYVSLAGRGLAPVRWIGRASLWIFVMHWPILLALSTLALRAGVPPDGLAMAALVLAIMPYLAGLAGPWGRARPVTTSTPPRSPPA